MSVMTRNSASSRLGSGAAGEQSPVRANHQGRAETNREHQPVAGYLPPGWPAQIPPPAVPDWELAATSWLLDCCPADYRSYPVLRRHPVVLARFAAEFVEGQIRSTRAALGEARPSLQDQVTPRVLDSAVQMLQAEEARLIRRRRAVALVEEALRGKIFIPKL